MTFYAIQHVDNSPCGQFFSMKRGAVSRAGKLMVDYLPSPGQLDVYYRAKAWPDLLYSLNGSIWSGRLLEAFLAGGLKGVQHFPLQLRNVDCKGLLKLPDPRYHWVLAEAGIPVVPSMPDLETPCPIEPDSGFYDLSVGGGIRRWRFDFASWQGQDLLCFSTTRSKRLVCTERFKNLVKESQFTNFRFVEEEKGGEGAYLM